MGKLSPYASHLKRPLSEIAIIDPLAIEQIESGLDIELTPTQLAEIASQIDISGKVDKIPGKGLSTNDLTDTLKSNYDDAHSHSQSGHLQFSGLAKITVGTTEPSNPSVGDLWINTNT